MWFVSCFLLPEFCYVSRIKFDKYSAIISSNIFLLHLPSPFRDYNYIYVWPLEVVPKLIDVLFIFFPVFLLFFVLGSFCWYIFMVTDLFFCSVRSLWVLFMSYMSLLNVLSVQHMKYSYTGIPCALLYCPLQKLLFFFLNKLKVYDNPASSKSVGIIFPTAFAHIMSLCHILVILTIF